MRRSCGARPGGRGPTEDPWSIAGSSRARRRLLGRRLAAAAGIHHLVADLAGILADGALDRRGDRRIGLQEGFGVLSALADALAIIGEPGAGLLHHAGGDAEIDELAGLRHALGIHAVELDD